jgi:hypothetical protein
VKPYRRRRPDPHDAGAYAGFLTATDAELDDAFRVRGDRVPAAAHPALRRIHRKRRGFYIDCLRALDAFYAGIEPSAIASMLYPRLDRDTRRRRLRYRLRVAVQLVEHGLLG